MSFPGQVTVSQLPKLIKENCSQQLWLPLGVKFGPVLAKNSISLREVTISKINHMYMYLHVIVTNVPSINLVTEPSCYVESITSE